MLDELEVLLLEEQRKDPKLFPRWLTFFRPVDRDGESENAENAVVSGVSRKLTEQTRWMETAQAGQLDAHKHWHGDVQKSIESRALMQAKTEADRQKEVDKQLAQIKEQQDNMQKEIKEQQAQMKAELEKLVRVVGAALKPWVQKPEPEPEPEPENLK